MQGDRQMQKIRVLLSQRGNMPIETCEDSRTDKTVSIIHAHPYNSVRAMSGFFSVAVLRLLQGGTQAGVRICPVRIDQEPLGAIRSFQRIEHR